MNSKLAGAVARALTLVALLPALALAQDAQTVRLVTPYPAGGPTDVIARVIAQPLGEELGHPVLVDN